MNRVDVHHVHRRRPQHHPAPPQPLLDVHVPAAAVRAVAPSSALFDRRARRSTLRRAHRRRRIDDWAFDAELLFLAKRRGRKIQEVPVRWEDQSGTKVRLLRDAWSSARGLLKIMSNQRRGLYDAPNEAQVNLEAWPQREAPSGGNAVARKAGGS